MFCSNEGMHTHCAGLKKRAPHGTTLNMAPTSLAGGIQKITPNLSRNRRKPFRIPKAPDQSRSSKPPASAGIKFSGCDCGAGFMAPNLGNHTQLTTLEKHITMATSIVNSNPAPSETDT